MTPRRRSAGHAASGQALLEFAITLPFFLLLLFGVIDFGRLLFTYISLSNGARELARTAAVSTNWSASNAITRFNNLTLIGGPQAPGTSGPRQVIVTTGSATCARAVDTGGTACASPPNTSVTCNLPLSTSTCSLSAPSQGGFVQVDATYTFDFNPLFQTRLEGILDVWFLRPTATLTTTARAYVE